MAITNIDPNNFDETFDAYYKSLPTGSIPGMTVPAINFRDAPVNFMMRKNNPALPFYKEPATNIKNIVQDFPGSIKSGIGKGFDLGKSIFGGIASLASGIPGIGALLGAFGPMTEEEKAMRDFYGSEFGLDDIGRVQSGIMTGYAPVSGFGGPGLSKSIDKRIETITKTLKKKKSKVLEQRLKELEALRQKEEQAREKDRADRARAANPGVYANLDKATGGKGYGDAGGFSTARAGKEGAFGTFDGSRGRKDYSKGGIVNLL